MTGHIVSEIRRRPLTAQWLGVTGDVPNSPRCAPLICFIVVQRLAKATCDQICFIVQIIVKTFIITTP